MVGVATFAAAAFSGFAVASAHLGCGGHDVAKRNPGGPLKEFVRRQTPANGGGMAAPTDEASGAVSEDPTYECTPYSYQRVLDMKPNYPTIWQTAYLMPGDSEAEALFATINATVNQKVPNDLPKGAANGDHTGVVYNNTDVDCWWTWRQCTTPAASLGIAADLTRTPEPNTWGFGFDDGPNCSHNALYDFLAENQQKATMFYIGSNVMDWPLQAMRGIEDGHEICVHTWSHQYMTSFTNDVAFAELYYTRKAIKELLGVTPTCWRPPFGDIDNRIRVIAAGLNLTSVVWSDDTEDWRIGTNNITAADIDENYENLIAAAKNGTWASGGPIVLNHELTNFTMSEMVKYYPQIKQAYAHVVPIAVAFNVTQPYAENNITYPDFQQYTAGQINQTSSGDATTTGGGRTGGAVNNSPSATTSSGSAAASTSAKAKGAAQLGAEIKTGPLALILVLASFALFL